jgi:hypothetical protein
MTPLHLFAAGLDACLLVCLAAHPAYIPARLPDCLPVCGIFVCLLTLLRQTRMDLARRRPEDSSLSACLNCSMPEGEGG